MKIRKSIFFCKSGDPLSSPSCKSWFIRMLLRAQINHAIYEMKTSSQALISCNKQLSNNSAICFSQPDLLLGKSYKTINKICSSCKLCEAVLRTGTNLTNSLPKKTILLLEEKQTNCLERFLHAPSYVQCPALEVWKKMLLTPRNNYILEHHETSGTT